MQYISWYSTAHSSSIYLGIVLHTVSSIFLGIVLQPVGDTDTDTPVRTCRSGDSTI